MSDTAAAVAKIRIQIETSLIEKASTDAAFRALLLADPRAAVKELLGVDPLPNYKMRVIEEAPGEALLVLPRQMNMDELPDDLLDLAAGGFLWWPGVRAFPGEETCKK